MGGSHHSKWLLRTNEVLPQDDRATRQLRGWVTTERMGIGDFLASSAIGSEGAGIWIDSPHFRWVTAAILRYGITQTI